MDSANNSGSMQSSSTAADEEYDSRADSSSISAFLNVPPPPFTTHHTHTHVFDPLSNYLDPTTQRSQPSPILNLDMMWSKVARSEPDLAGLIPSSPHNNNNHNHNHNQAFLFTQLGGQSQTSFLPSTLPPESGSSRGGLLSVSAANELQQQQQPQNSNNINSNNVVRNPKKRSRASRRAPTTVLTTDTTNFRAMVQEFTGIPAPPFNSSPFPRTRLDLFSSSSPTTPPPYLLRPFPQKPSIPPSSFPPMLDTLPSNNYQHMHNPNLTLQPPPKYPSSVLASKTQQQPSLEIPPNAVGSSHLKMGGLEELGLSHAHVGGHHHNMVQPSSDGALSRVNNNNINSSMRGPAPDWAQTQRIGNNDGGVLRTLNYRSNVSDQRVSNGKVNFSATPSDFHGDKGPECAVAARSEGMVESWINCSSD